MSFSYSLIVLINLCSLASILATLCYECPNPSDTSNCSLINSDIGGRLGCLIEFEDANDTGLTVSRITQFCPTSLVECVHLSQEKNFWLTFVWKMHQQNTKQLRKNPIMKMWYECFHDRCNSPDFIQSLKTVTIHWDTQQLNMQQSTLSTSTKCFVCGNQTVPFVCTSSHSCENGCKMQGYRINANPYATRLLSIYDVKYWQPKCNDDLLDYQSANISLNGYLINNLNTSHRNLAIEVYCSHDECNRLDLLSGFMNTVSIKFQDQPWLSSAPSIRQISSITFLVCIAIKLSIWLK